MFAAALFGTLTRSPGFLSSLWPANALLIALMLRKPHLSGTAGWLGAAIGYLAADLITGGGVLLTAWLTLANMANAMLCVALFQRADVEDRQLRRPAAIARLLAICVCGALLATAIGAGALVEFFGADPINAIGTYFASELGNGLIVLPMALSAPSIGTLRRWGRRADDNKRPWRARAALPALVLLAALLLGEAIDGPARVVLFVPAIIWCALSYKLFATASLMFVVGLWHLVQLAPDIHAGQNAFFHSVISIRLAFGFLALGPMSITLTRSAHAELVDALRTAASRDVLTGALSRGAFLERADQVMGKSASAGPLPAVLMIDVDRFKATNDSFGHAAGDSVLAAIGAAVAQLMRQDDLFGRLGGEEFAILLPEITPDNAMIVAERVRAACETIALQSDDGEPIGVSVSIGVACAADAGRDLGELMKAADQALYAAKRAGRNRVALWATQSVEA